MPRNDSAVAGGSLWGAEARETSGCCSNASRTLKTRLRAHGGSGHYRPAAGSSIHTVPRVGVITLAVEAYILESNCRARC
jgi:hypothetical protein